MNKVVKQWLLYSLTGAIFLSSPALAAITCADATALGCVSNPNTFSCANDMSGWVYDSGSKSGYNYAAFGNKQQKIPFTFQKVVMKPTSGTYVTESGSTKTVYSQPICYYINKTYNLSIAYTARYPHAPTLTEANDWQTINANTGSYRCISSSPEACPLEMWPHGSSSGQYLE